MKKIFFDTEFTGLTKNTTLISIGMIDEDGKKCSIEYTDYDRSQVNDWIKKNVIDNLYIGNIISSGFTFPGRENEFIIRGDQKHNTVSLRSYINQTYKDEEIMFVSDVCHYDFVLLIDALYKHGLNVPKNVCANCYDINQDIARYYNISLIDAFNKSREEILSEHGVTIEGKKHNSLYDAKVIKAIYEIINKNNN